MGIQTVIKQKGVHLKLHIRGFKRKGVADFYCNSLEGNGTYTECFFRIA